MVTSIIRLIIILVILPFCMGLIPAFFIEKSKRNHTLIYLMGMIYSLALFQLVAIPVVIFAPDRFRIIVWTYLILTSMSAIAGLILAGYDMKRNGNPFKNHMVERRNITGGERALWLIAILFVLLQMIMYVFTQAFDGDDAYYVVESLLTSETNTLYSIKPYTGLTTSIDLRHALASMPIWIAYIARISGIHSTIIAHTVIGLVMIPLLYMVYYQCALQLLKKDRRKIPIFLIFVSIMYIFGDVSIYTNATFMLTRTWQGKSMLANFILLSIIWLILAIHEIDGIENEWRVVYYLTLFELNIVAAMCSTASVFLVAMLIGLSGLAMSIHKKDPQPLLKLLVTCVPLVAYGSMYMLI